MSDFKTMLADKAPPIDQIKFPVIASPKLDGVRCHIMNGIAVSRNLLAFKNPALQSAFGLVPLNGLDGEFMVGDPTHAEAFRKTGVLNSHDGDISDVKLWVFDDFTSPNEAFKSRLNQAVARIRAAKLPQLERVPHKLIKNAEELAEYEAEMVGRGFEGIMLRDPLGRYKYGRSTTREGLLLKMKRFEDGEAEVIGAEERMHNANEKTLMRNGKFVRNTKKEGLEATGMLGAIQVRDLKTGVEFSIGSGFVDDERIGLWQQHLKDPGTLLGRIAKYQFFPTGSKDKPRFPTFKGWRDRADL